MIWILYNDKYREVNSKEYPVLMDSLSRKNLTLKTDENAQGDLRNWREVNRKFAGLDENLILSEIFFEDLKYSVIIDEIGAGEHPVIWYKPLNVMIQIKRQSELLIV